MEIDEDEIEKSKDKENKINEEEKSESNDLNITTKEKIYYNSKNRKKI